MLDVNIYTYRYNFNLLRFRIKSHARYGNLGMYLLIQIMHQEAELLLLQITLMSEGKLPKI